jgi:hypothetical protein
MLEIRESLKLLKNLKKIIKILLKNIKMKSRKFKIRKIKINHSEKNFSKNNLKTQIIRRYMFLLQKKINYQINSIKKYLKKKKRINNP